MPELYFLKNRLENSEQLFDPVYNSAIIGDHNTAAQSNKAHSKVNTKEGSMDAADLMPSIIHIIHYWLGSRRRRRRRRLLLLRLLLLLSCHLE